jgi:predicted acetyltransferase
MESERIELALPTLALEAAYQDCEVDFQRAGENFLSPAQDDYARFIEHLDDYRLGTGGLVPQIDYFLLRDGRAILGRSGLRLRLTAPLQDIGGHIGYRIRPSERRKGYGTRLLTLTLAEAKKHRLREVLLTCDSDNIGSRRIIERNGGQLASEDISSRSGVLVARYWIHL